jgi:CHAT domain-containing protein
VIVEAAQCSYLHFSSHGYHDWHDTMNSGLLLANGELFNLSEIISKLDLSKARLVTLSVSESGSTKFWESPDTYVGLPAGFLQVGAPGVLMSLWPVSDLSAMLLLERFYSNHLNGMEPPAALREAQLWLRKVPAGELATRFATERRTPNLKGNVPSEQASAAWRQFVSFKSSAQPFDHPFYWAAFAFTGI